MRDKKIQKNGGKKMDAGVYEVVTHDFQPAHIVVQTKAKTTHGSVEILGIEKVRIEGSLDRGPGEIVHMDIGIGHDVAGVVKMPRAVQRIGIDKRDKKGQREC